MQFHYLESIKRMEATFAQKSAKCPRIVTACERRLRNIPQEVTGAHYQLIGDLMTEKDYNKDSKSL